VKEALAYSPLTVLAKPCSPDQVLETVRKVQQSEETSMWKKNQLHLQKTRFQPQGGHPRAAAVM
jgi:hypothetical protein